MKKLKSGHHFINIDHTEKIQITKLLKVCISGFLSVDGNRILASAIMKKIEKWLTFHKYQLYGTFQITNPTNFGSLVFQVSIETEYQHWPL